MKTRAAYSYLITIFSALLILACSAPAPKNLTVKRHGTIGPQPPAKQPDKTSSRGMLAPQPQPAKSYGSVYINSTPQGAVVYVDSVLVNGKTPTEVKNVEVGTHNIMIVLDGYAPLSKTVTVSANTRLNVAGVLKAQETSVNKGPKFIPPEHTVLAIYSVEAQGVAPSLAQALTPHLAFVINKYRDKVRIVQNEAVEKVLDQVGMAASGACTDSECLPELGKLLGANRFLVSSIAKLGTKFTIYATVYDAESGVAMFSDIEQCKCSEEDLPNMLENLSSRIMAKLNGKM